MQRFVLVFLCFNRLPDDDDDDDDDDTPVPKHI